jgi:5'-nucleotidase / UDP-sugar diphosphatase
MNLFKRLSLGASLALFLTTHAETHLTILHTNDHHGYYWCRPSSPDAPCEGGFPAQATLVKKIRQEVAAIGGSTLLLSGGDINTGAPESNIFKAEPDFRGMGLMKFDAMAVGNHEFDNDLSIIRKQQTWGGFPFLAANIYHKDTNKRVFEPFITRRIQGLKILIVGVTTEDTPKEANPDHTRQFEFRNPIKEVRKIVDRNHFDILIVVSHLGHQGEAVPGFQSMGDQALARGVPEIDVIVGGHSHRLETQPIKVGKTLILQVQDNARYLGRLDLKLNAQRKVAEFQYAAIPINLKGTPVIPDDPEMISLLKPFNEQAEKLLDSKIVGHTEVDLDGEREHVRNGPTNLGQLITSRLQTYTHSDIALMNAGGIRKSIPAGDIRPRQWMDVNPYNDAFVVVKLTGRELLEYLDKTWEKNKGGGGYLHFSGINGSPPPYILNDEPLDETGNYTIAMPYFIANGGNGYPELLKIYATEAGRIRFTGVRFLEVMEVH